MAEQSGSPVVLAMAGNIVAVGGYRWRVLPIIFQDVMSSSAIMGALQQTVSRHDGCIVASQCIKVFIINWLCYYRQYKIRKQASSREGVR